MTKRQTRDKGNPMPATRVHRTKHSLVFVAAPSSNIASRRRRIDVGLLEGRNLHRFLRKHGPNSIHRSDAFAGQIARQK